MNPFGSHILRRIRLNRIHGNGFRPLLLQGAEITSVVVERRVPVNIIRHYRITAPEDDTF